MAGKDQLRNREFSYVVFEVLYNVLIGILAHIFAFNIPLTLTD